MRKFIVGAALLTLSITVAGCTRQGAATRPTAHAGIPAAAMQQKGTGAAAHRSIRPVTPAAHTPSSPLKASTGSHDKPANESTTAKH